MWVAVGVVVAVGGSLDFFSLVEGTGVADVNALDCAHDGSANRKTTAMANARRFIFVESLPRSSKLKPTITLIRTLQGTQVLTRRFEIAVTQTVSLRARLNALHSSQTNSLLYKLGYYQQPRSLPAHRWFVVV